MKPATCCPSPGAIKGVGLIICVVLYGGYNQPEGYDLFHFFGIFRTLGYLVNGWDRKPSKIVQAFGFLGMPATPQLEKPCLVISSGLNSAANIAQT